MKFSRLFKKLSKFPLNFPDNILIPLYLQAVVPLVPQSETQMQEMHEQIVVETIEIMDSQDERQDTNEHSLEIADEGNEPLMLRKESEHKCNICATRFASMFDLIQHHNLEHLDLPNQVGFTFVTSLSLLLFLKFFFFTFFSFWNFSSHFCLFLQILFSFFDFFRLLIVFLIFFLFYSASFVVEHFTAPRN